LVTAVLQRYFGTTAGVYRGSIKKKEPYHGNAVNEMPPAVPVFLGTICHLAVKFSKQMGALLKNLFFDAVDRFREFINNKKSDLKDVFTHFNVPYFRPAEEDYIREYVKIMRPLTEALDILQADVKVSIGYLLPLSPF
jgi:hypothetical protein